MGKPTHSAYIDAARQVLDELGGGPMSSRDLVAAAQERGLAGTGKWVYHALLRKVRESDEFDTSQRGYVSLAGGESMVSEDPGVVDPLIVSPEASKPGNTDPILEEAAIPGTDPLMEQNDEEDEDNPFETTA